MTITIKSQDLSNNQKTCDSIINKKAWASTSYDKTIFADFDLNGNLKTFGYLNKKKKTGQWYYFTNNICDSICMFNNDKRTGKSYYFSNGEIRLITFLWKNNKMDTCYNPEITKEYYLTESFGMDGCIQSGLFYYCNGIRKNYFPFNVAIDKIEDLCLKIGGISKAEYSSPKDYKLSIDKTIIKH